jgi:hypothetical protein
MGKHTPMFLGFHERERFLLLPNFFSNCPISPANFTYRKGACKRVALFRSPGSGKCPILPGSSYFFKTLVNLVLVAGEHFC